MADAAAGHVATRARAVPGTAGQALLLAPMLLGAGIAAFFALPQEPSTTWGWAALALTLTGIGMLSVPPLRGLALLLALPALGFAVAQWRTHAVAAPVLAAPVTALVEGRVVGLSQSAGGLPRLLLDEVTVFGLAPEATPARLRVTLRRAGDAARAPVGTRLSVMADLMPPGGPLAPDAFDFRRVAWFDRLGAIGTSRGALVVLPPEPGDAAAMPVARLRAAVSAHLRQTIGGPAGAFAAAIVTGDRSGLPPAAVEALRVSGLAHLLAISGLHMAIVGGLVFSAMRLGLAAVPGLAEHWRIKQVAAVAALAAALGYLVLSGAGVATQRAFLMAAVALVGVLLDRPAVSLRGLALAACLVLLAAPESLLAVGFQMSFAATLALVAVYGALRRRELALWGGGLRRRLLRYCAALVLTSLVAGLATAPFAAFHFNRMATFGLIANLAAVPMMGLWVAPSLAAGGVLEALGLGGPLLSLAGAGIERILAVAQAIAALPAADRVVPSAASWVLGTLALGGLALALCTGRLRAAGAVAILVALAVWPISLGRDEVLLVAPDARVVALRGPEGLVPEAARRGAYVTGRWLARDGDRATAAVAAARPGWREAEGWLMAEPAPGVLVALTRERRPARAAIATYCSPGGVLIAPAAHLATDGPCHVLDAPRLDPVAALVFRLEDNRLVPQRVGHGWRLWHGPAQ